MLARVGFLMRVAAEVPATGRTYLPELPAG